MSFEYNLEKQHAKGKLHAIERINLLCDKGSFMEIYSEASHQCTNFGMESKKEQVKLGISLKIQQVILKKALWVSMIILKQAIMRMDGFTMSFSMARRQFPLPEVLLR